MLKQGISLSSSLPSPRGYCEAGRAGGEQEGKAEGVKMRRGRDKKQASKQGRKRKKRRKEGDRRGREYRKRKRTEEIKQTERK